MQKLWNNCWRRHLTISSVGWQNNTAVWFSFCSNWLQHLPKYNMFQAPEKGASPEPSRENWTKLGELCFVWFNQKLILFAIPKRQLCHLTKEIWSLPPTIPTNVYLVHDLCWWSPITNHFRKGFFPWRYAKRKGEPRSLNLNNPRCNTVFFCTMYL